MYADAFVVSQPPDLAYYDWLCDPSNPDRLSDSAQELIELLRSLSRKRGFAWPRQSAIAEMMNKSVDRVKQLVREVKDAGLIIIKRGRQNFYRLVSAVFIRPNAVTPSITPSITPSQIKEMPASEQIEKSCVDNRALDRAKEDNHVLDYTPRPEARVCSPSNPSHAHSKFTLAQCILFAISLRSAGITTPRAYGAAIWRDGREDDRIAEFLSATTRDTATNDQGSSNAPQQECRNSDPNCPHCFGLGVRYEGNNWLTADLVPCDCYINNERGHAPGSTTRN